MGYFIITLPNNSRLNVRFGYVTKKTSLINFFRKNKIHADKKKGYVITDESNQKEYRLLKTLDGKWFDKEESGFNTCNNEIAIHIKKAIDEFEKN